MSTLLLKSFYQCEMYILRRTKTKFWVFKIFISVRSRFQTFVKIWSVVRNSKLFLNIYRNKFLQDCLLVWMNPISVLWMYNKSIDTTQMPRQQGRKKKIVVEKEISLIFLNPILFTVKKTFLVYYFEQNWMLKLLLGQRSKVVW